MDNYTPGLSIGFSLLAFVIFPYFLSAQLYYEGFVYDNFGVAQIDEPADVSFSPNGDFIFVCSHKQDAINVFSFAPTSPKTVELLLENDISFDVLAKHIAFSSDLVKQKGNFAKMNPPKSRTTIGCM